MVRDTDRGTAEDTAEDTLVGNMVAAKVNKVAAADSIAYNLESLPYFYQ
jgi:hypothetical protein